MDREAHGEDSSSRNGNPFIVLELQQRGTEGSRFRVVLSDGSSFFCSSTLIGAFGLRVGTSLDEDAAERFRTALFHEQAVEKAIAFLTVREHSREELKRKLLKRKFPAPVIRDVLDYLQAHGYLNTERFAEEWVLSRLAHHPEGRNMLFAGLVGHGVSRVAAEAVLYRILTDEVVLDSAIRAAEKFTRKSGCTEQKLKKRLFSLGFDRRITMQVMERMQRFF